MSPRLGVVMGGPALRAILLFAVILPALGGTAKDREVAERRLNRPARGGGRGDPAPATTEPAAEATPNPNSEASNIAGGLRNLVSEATDKVKELQARAEQADLDAKDAIQKNITAAQEVDAAEKALLQSEADLVKFKDEENRQPFNTVRKEKVAALAEAKKEAHRTAEVAVTLLEANRSAYQALADLQVKRESLMQGDGDIAPTAKDFAAPAPAAAPTVPAAPFAAREAGQSEIVADAMAHDHSHAHGHEDHDSDADDAELEEEHHDDRWLNVSKFTSIVIMILSAFMGIVLRVMCPALNDPTCFGFVNVVAGGMFIGMGMFHILPETIDHAPRSVKTMFTSTESSLSIQIWCVLGFLVVLFFDRVASNWSICRTAEEDEIDEEALKDVLNPRRRNVPGGAGSRSSSFARTPRVRSGSGGKELEMSQDVQRSVAESHGHGSMHGSLHGSQVAEPGHAHGDGHGHSHGNGGRGSGHGHAHSEAQGGGHGHAHGGGHGHSHGMGDMVDKSIGGAALLAMSLSFHAIFEGVVVGTAEDVETVWLLLVVIAAHKWAEVLAIANQLSHTQSIDVNGCTLLVCFTLASPLGTAIGWAIAGAHTGWSQKLESLLNSFAVGALLYIGMVEVIPEEFNGSRKCRKFILLLIGVGVILLLSIFHLETAHSGCCDGHDHSHGHSHGHSHRH